jgi:hypothetical protein
MIDGQWVVFHQHLKNYNAGTIIRQAQKEINTLLL